MTIEIIKGNLIEGGTEAIILTVDGAAKGMEGNIARAFARKYPEVWEALEYDIQYPIALGQARAFPIDDELGCKNKLVIIASTLHHIEVLTDDEKTNVIRRAMHHAISLALRYNVNTIGSAIMSGGWRLEPRQALDVMIDVYLTFRSSNSDFPTLRIYILLQADFKSIAEHLLVTQKKLEAISNGYTITT
jgi:O-acetyl-ADP-ribose deacetylase (regulator of RNase III)